MATKEHTEHYDKIESIREFLEHAPNDNHMRAPELRGFVTGLGHKVCEVCSNRFGQRGNMPATWKPIWDSSERANEACGVCGETPAKE